MKFDVIIGNPPYQLSVGNTGANSSYAPAIYHLFVDKSREMNPKYITMIVPSRWMTNNAEGISEKWVKELIESNKFKIIHDYENADNLFNGVGIIGGVNYFLWDRDHSGSCDYHYHYEDGGTEKWQGKLNIFSEDIVVRNPSFHSIIKKVSKIHGNYYKKEDDNFSSLVSSSHFFDKGGVMGSGWRDYSIEKDKINNIKYYVSKSTNNVEYGWVSEGQIPKNREAVRLNKVLIPAAHGGQSQVLGYPRYAEKNSVSSQTYLVIGYDYRKHNLTEKECFNIISYIKTKFFRFMVKIRKVTQNGARGVYQFVPLQDFSKPWTDAELYKKYGLTEEEIAYIEENIAPMTDDTTVSEEDTQKTT